MTWDNILANVVGGMVASALIWLGSAQVKRARENRQKKAESKEQLLLRLANSPEELNQHTRQYLIDMGIDFMVGVVLTALANILLVAISGSAGLISSLSLLVLGGFYWVKVLFALAELRRLPNEIRHRKMMADADASIAAAEERLAKLQARLGETGDPDGGV